MSMSDAFLVFGTALEASSSIVCASEPAELLQADLHLLGNMLDADPALAARFFRHFAGLIARQLAGAYCAMSEQPRQTDR